MLRLYNIVQYDLILYENSMYCNIIQWNVVWNAIVESHLRYANEIWGSLPKSKLDILQRLQDRAPSIVENARYKDNWSCDWLSVENIIRFDRSVITYKIGNKLSPERLWDKFQQRSSRSNYATVQIFRSLD